VKSCDVITCLVTATYRELQHCRSSNVHKTRLFGLRQPLPGDFRRNDVPYGSLLVRSRDVISCPVLPPPASCSPVGAQTYTKPEFSAFYSHFLVISDEMNFRVTSHYVRSCDVICFHVTATSCKLQPCRNSNVHKTRVFGLLQPLPGDFW